MQTNTAQQQLDFELQQPFVFDATNSAYSASLMDRILSIISSLRSLPPQQLYLLQQDFSSFITKPKTKIPTSNFGIKKATVPNSTPTSTDLKIDFVIFV